VSFAAIILCVTSQRVFLVVRVKRDPRFSVLSEMADLKEQSICVKFCFKLGKTASKTHEILKPAFGDNAMERTQTLSFSLDSNMGGTSRAWWRTFLTVRALFTSYLFLQAKR
jgi:hypothetical protein